MLYMCVIIVPESQAWSVRRAPALPVATETMPRYARPPIGTALTADHDATLLVAALEEIDTRRMALEWLLEADLLGRCLV
jgi:hypothetical protein